MVIMKALIKKLLPVAFIALINSCRISVNHFLSRLLGKYRFTSALYYFIFDRQFYREQQATLAGKNSYNLHKGVADNSSALLRRNTHRLEKGLIMTPRKPVFAENYIVETVDCLALCLHKKNISPSELKWAQDVLSHYFTVVATSAIIEQAKAILRETVTFYDKDRYFAPDIVEASAIISDGDLNQFMQQLLAAGSNFFDREMEDDEEFIKTDLPEGFIHYGDTIIVDDDE